MKIDWFYRYDAYVVASGLLALASLAQVVRIGSGVPGQVLLIAVLVPLCVVRGLPALQNTTRGARNIFEQQAQMARLFASHFRNEVVAVNDIGLVAWEGDVRVLDMAAWLRRKWRICAGTAGGPRPLSSAWFENPARWLCLFMGTFSGLPALSRFLDAHWDLADRWQCRGCLRHRSFLAPEPRHAKKVYRLPRAFQLELPSSVATTLEPLPISCP